LLIIDLISILKSTKNYPTMCGGYKQKTPLMWRLLNELWVVKSSRK